MVESEGVVLKDITARDFRDTKNLWNDGQEGGKREGGETS